ncbi:ureidoglycolate lyase [Aestuariivirga litoralis]|uniref:ureidoglycolate lyase n=1 Tax=Aestuariivirga litoralis TaxID=2650924 RepID=UPI0018C497AE|nr:ureidoglycolate lyase [Aestuariivirga litoralis]MBG1233077.1 ureidoglycolate lyase [Aestuariivirga litoralis]
MKIEKLTRKGFAAFGDVIELAGAKHYGINQGFAERYDDLCNVDVIEGGAVKVSLFDVKPRPHPICIDLMERHPLGSQAFYPLQDEDWLVLVCGAPKDENSYRCFRATGKQGINYARNTWHFPLLVFAPSRFIIVDRKGPGNNLEEVMLEKALFLAP